MKKQPKELHVIQVRDRWLVTTKPMVESIYTDGVLANFGDREHAEAWRDRYTQWRAELAA